MDFGIARASRLETVTQTAAAMLGTAQYISPEQAQGQTVDYRSDLYSLGCCLYEMLTGTVPFTGATPVAHRLPARPRGPGPAPAAQPRRPGAAGGDLPEGDGQAARQPLPDGGRAPRRPGTGAGPGQRGRGRPGRRPAATAALWPRRCCRRPDRLPAELEPGGATSAVGGDGDRRPGGPPRASRRRAGAAAWL